MHAFCFFLLLFLRFFSDNIAKRKRKNAPIENFPFGGPEINRKMGVGLYINGKIKLSCHLFKFSWEKILHNCAHKEKSFFITILSFLKYDCGSQLKTKKFPKNCVCVFCEQVKQDSHEFTIKK